jgi:hypothetical protein
LSAKLRVRYLQPTKPNVIPVVSGVLKTVTRVMNEYTPSQASVALIHSGPIAKMFESLVRLEQH